MTSLNTEIWILKHPLIAMVIIICAVNLLELQSYRYDPKVPNGPDIVYGGPKIPAEQYHQRCFGWLIIFSLMINLIFISLIYQEIWAGVLVFTLLDLVLLIYKMRWTDINSILVQVDTLLLVIQVWPGLSLAYLLKIKNIEYESMATTGKPLSLSLLFLILCPLFDDQENNY